MPLSSTVKKLTPNLIVSNVEQSIAFYRDVLGFTPRSWIRMGT